MTVVQSNELAAEDAIGIARQNEPGDQTHRRIATRGSICLLPGIIARHSRAVPSRLAVRADFTWVESVFPGMFE
jgi:hypothetical protein